jgi:hypothetical protein
MQWWIAVSELIRNFGLLGAAVVGVILAAFRVVAAIGKPLPPCVRQSWRAGTT